ncbi:polysaccharide deacetylase family protein [Kineococcus sp. GCM10028916]|uniref:polysaccharide deacetylase family protein n=1 Tax=Kineococcus sp. GCM10028916 TaxID=3273394 RepID=UPI003641046C
MSDALDPGEVRRVAAAIAAEDEERAGVAMFLGLQPPPPRRDDPAHADVDLGRRLGVVWDVLAAADPDVTVQDALAVLADLEFRPVRARAGSEVPDRLAAWRPEGWRTPPRAERDAGAARVRDALVGGRLLRVVNYHDTPLSRQEEFRVELQGYAARFDPVSAADVLDFFATGRWRTGRPGIVPAFFDGFASAVRCAAPLLAETGLTGWFYPPTEFLDVRPGDQQEFARAHDYGVLEHPGDRLAMTWDELARLAEDHEVCGHTATHAASPDVVSDDDVERQVREPVRRLTEVCGRTPAAWAWLGGTPYDPGAPGDRAVLAAGIPLLTSNATLERLPS